MSQHVDLSEHIQRAVDEANAGLKVLEDRHLKLPGSDVVWRIYRVIAHEDIGGWPLLDLQLVAVNPNRLEPVLVIREEEAK